MNRTKTELAIHYEQNAILAALQQQAQPELPAEIESWLGRLGLLYGVPFENLVPDARMLPPESLRFFYVDTNWLEALVDGAFSVGVHSDRDIRYHKVMQHVIRDATDVAAGKLRRDLRGERHAEELSPPLTRDQRTQAGFLMRSAVVAGWPGLEISGYRDYGKEEEEKNDADTTLIFKPEDKLNLLRLERLAPDLLICIFADIPKAVVINEPAEDFHFGFEFKDPGYQLWLRDPISGNRLVGGPEEDEEIPIPWRDNNAELRVIDVVGLRKAIRAKKPGQAADTAKAKATIFGAANFAVQMIDAPDQQIFTPDIALDSESGGE